MAYVSLYRKYRPQTFADVVGQRHVTQTLVNAIAEDRLHHAYLFTGPRGTGKTSTARILAKALNCEAGPTATPCNTCDICVSITTGSSVDVIELDMASHGGVDDARELRDRALFAPAVARKKVYILDEVHMASTAAFNALLKLIEEPPGHVVFAMATTDPQKVIPTIMSRVQRLDLRRVAAPEVAEHVRRLCELEGYGIEEAAVDAVVRAGDGSVRDTMSVLEQVLSYSGREVTAEKVAQTLGHTPAERTFEAVARVGDRDLAGLLALVQGLMDDGHDLRRFAFDLLQHLRDLLVLQVAPGRPDLVDATRERRERLAAQAGLLARETLLRAVDLLSETVTEQRQGPPRLPLELALAKLAVPGAGGDVADLADRIARLERRGDDASPGRGRSVEAASAARTEARAPSPDVAAATAATDPATEPEPTGEVPEPERPVLAEPELGAAEPAAERLVAAEPAAHAVSEPATDATDHAPAAAEPPTGATDEAPADATDERPTDTIDAAAEAAEAAAPARGDGADDLAAIQQRWDAILDLVKGDKRRFHAVFEPAEPIKLARGVLTLRYPARYRSFHAENARKGEYATSLQNAVERSCGLKVKVDVHVEGDAKRAPQPPVVTADPVADEPAPPPDPEEEAAVREAELADAAPRDPGDAAAQAARLLSDELGAERIAGPGTDGDPA